MFWHVACCMKMHFLNSIRAELKCFGQCIIRSMFIWNEKKYFPSFFCFVFRNEWFLGAFNNEPQPRTVVPSHASALTMNKHCHAISLQLAIIQNIEWKECICKQNGEFDDKFQGFPCVVASAVKTYVPLLRHGHLLLYEFMKNHIFRQCQCQNTIEHKLSLFVVNISFRRIFIFIFSFIFRIQSYAM